MNMVLLIVYLPLVATFQSTWEELTQAGYETPKIKNYLEPICVYICGQEQVGNYSITRVSSDGDLYSKGTVWRIKLYNSNSLDLYRYRGCRLEIHFKGEPPIRDGFYARVIKKWGLVNGTPERLFVFPLEVEAVPLPILPKPPEDSKKLTCDTCVKVKAIALTRIRVATEPQILSKLSDIELDLDKFIDELARGVFNEWVRILSDLPEGIPECCIQLAKLFDVETKNDYAGFNTNEYTLNQDMHNFLMNQAETIKERVWLYNEILKECRYKDIRFKITSTGYCDSDSFNGGAILLEGKNIAGNSLFGSVLWSRSGCENDQLNALISIPYMTDSNDELPKVPYKMIGNCHLSAVRAYNTLDGLLKYLDLPIEGSFFYRPGGVLPYNSSSSSQDEISQLKAASRKFSIQIKIIAGGIKSDKMDE